MLDVLKHSSQHGVGWGGIGKPHEPRPGNVELLTGTKYVCVCVCVCGRGGAAFVLGRLVKYMMFIKQEEQCSPIVIAT